MIGLALDLFGAFFVAVEAIKLENLRNFKEIILKKVHLYTKSPRIVVVDEDGKEMNKLEGGPLPSERIPGLFMALHNVAGFIVLIVLNTFLDGKLFEWLMILLLWIMSKPWYLIIVAFILFVLFGIVAGLWVVGEIVHVLIEKSVVLSMKLLDMIDNNTANGTIGIIGFLLLAIGFCLQFYGAYMSGSTS